MVLKQILLETVLLLNAGINNGSTSDELICYLPVTNVKLTLSITFPQSKGDAIILLATFSKDTMSLRSYKVLLVYLSVFTTLVHSDAFKVEDNDNETIVTRCDELRQDCTQLQYLSLLKVLNATLSSQSYNGVKSQLSFESINPGNSYSAAFENYIVRNRFSAYY